MILCETNKLNAFCAVYIMSLFTSYYMGIIIPQMGFMSIEMHDHVLHNTVIESGKMISLSPPYL